VEDLGPGVLEAAGLAPDALARRNPRLAVLRISPFGQTGPLAHERGDDRIAQAFGGVQFATGYPDRPPIPVSVPIAAAWTGVHGASGLLMAIFHARRSGHGQVVDLGLYQTVLRMQEDVVVRYEREGAITSRLGTESPTVVPANVYRSRDGGWIALSGAGDQPFARLCEVIGAPDAPKDPRFATGAARLQHRDAANALVGAWVAAHGMTEVERRFAASGVTGTAVRSVDEILGDEHVEARRSLLALRSPTGRAFAAAGPVPQLSRTPARRAERAPALGADTAAVRAGVESLAARARPAAPAAVSGGGALAGVRVLDLSQWLAGPAAAALLGDFGADVIMVELPGATAQARGPGFVVTNRNKRSLTLDVRAPAGHEVFLALARRSDVIIENFRPGTLERWDLAPDTLLAANPRLVIVRSSGFGQTGPHAGRAAFNPVGLAYGGMTYLNGWPDRAPLRDGVTAGDYTTALFNVLGALAALLRRDVDGQGQVVDTAMFEAALRMTGDALAVRSALGQRRERAAGDWPLFPASATAEAEDGRFVAVSAASEDELVAALERLLGRRPAGAGPGRDALAAWIRGRAADQAVAELRRAGLAASAVNSVADLVREPHLWSRGDLVRVPHPELGEIVTQGVVPLLSLTPGRVGGWSRFPGSETDAVLGEVLGYSPEAIRAAAGTPQPSGSAPR
jgi:crotonobetainyl-CoA:carnitine CoA-transferase CaiB-like acyl-CoA transferase